MTGGTNSPKAFRADIQGLRAIAVLAVVAFHARPSLVSGGFVGVDVFFVISGFLITQILLRELGEDRFSLVGFYQRRVRRLFPALFLMLATVLVLASVVQTPDGFKDNAHAALATVFFVSNLEFMQTTGYFGTQASGRPLLHTWSLAVEEQFYIVFPLLLAGLWAWARTWLKPILLCLAIASLAASALLLPRAPDFAFYFAPTRAFELLIGALIACGAAPPFKSARTRDIASIAGLLMIGVSIVFYSSERTPFPGLAALLPCLGTALVIQSGLSTPSLGGRLISSGPFLFFGAISYSLYLWHWPLLVLMRKYFLGETFWLHTGATLVAAVALAWLSWKFVELPFLRTRPKRLPVLKLAAGAMALAAMAAVALVSLDGLPQRFSPKALSLLASAQDYNPRRSRCHGDKTLILSYDKNCTFGARGATPTIAVWSDSHGTELVAALGERLAPAGGAVLAITASACPPAVGFEVRDRGDCTRHNAETLQRLKRDPRIRRVVMAANFIDYEYDWPGFSKAYAETAKALAASGKELVLVEQTPLLHYDAPAALAFTLDRGGDPSGYGLSRADYDAATADSLVLVQKVAFDTHAKLVKASEILCDHRICPAYSAREGALYFNRTHLSVAGARRLAAQVPLGPPAKPLLAGHSPRDPGA